MQLHYSHYTTDKTSLREGRENHKWKVRCICYKLFRNSLNIPENATQSRIFLIIFDQLNGCKRWIFVIPGIYGCGLLCFCKHHETKYVSQDASTDGVSLATGYLQVSYFLDLAAKANHSFKWNSSKLWEIKWSSEVDFFRNKGVFLSYL